MTIWVPQQNDALALAGAWLRMRYQPTFYLAGYAGTGKTTLAMHLAQHATGEVAFAAFTGKAARVMRQKGCVGARTIHSLIYNTEVTADGKAIVTLKHTDALSKYCLVVVDESSMVDEQMGQDLLSFGKPVLVLGDPAQLPPVSGGGYFTPRTPDYMLTEVHRQAADSPIIRLATEIREGAFKRERQHEDGLTVIERRFLDPARVTDAGIVIVGRNGTRQAYNARLRELAGKTDKFPTKGESLICLRNDRAARIFNGDIFETTKTKLLKDVVRLWMKDPDDGRTITPLDVRREFFEDDLAASKMPYAVLRGTAQFTFGYAITCHKSQGSQWDDVCVFDESSTFREDATRWLYTAVTRAAERLTLVL